MSDDSLYKHCGCGQKSYFISERCWKCNTPLNKEAQAKKYYPGWEKDLEKEKKHG